MGGKCHCHYCHWLCGLIQQVLFQWYETYFLLGIHLDEKRTSISTRLYDYEFTREKKSHFVSFNGH